jgi:hypothetical protein
VHFIHLNFICGTGNGRLELTHGLERRVDDGVRCLTDDDFFLNDGLRLFRGSSLPRLAFLCWCRDHLGLAGCRLLGLHAGGIAGSPLPARGTDRPLRLRYRLAGDGGLDLLGALGRHDVVALSYGVANSRWRVCCRVKAIGG